MKEFTLVELEEKELPALQKLSGEMGIPDDEVEDSNKHNLIFRVLEAQAKKNGLLFSEGVLECLDDGFGFLRISSLQYRIFVRRIIIYIPLP